MLARKVVGLARARAQIALHPRMHVAGTPMFFGRRPILQVDGEMHVGTAFRVRALQFPASLGCGPGATLTIGDDVFVNQGVNVFAAGSVTVGSHVHLADLAAIYDTDFHPVDASSPTRVAPVVLEDRVWVGRGAIILPGVTVGRGSVVAAGAVVTGDVPAGVVVAGNPARTVRELDGGEVQR